MRTLNLLSWLYDVKLDDQGIRFVLFGFLTVHLLRFENIEDVIELPYGGLQALTAYNFKNRLFARCFLIKKRRGWFTRKVLITPDLADEFVAALVRNRVRVRLLSQNS